MPKKIFIIFSVISICLVSWASAEQSREQKAKHADINKDGAVDTKEQRIERKWEDTQRSMVDARWRKKADTNGDGKVDKGELSAWNKLKKERIDLNKDGIIDAKERRLYWKHGRSRVNTTLESKYDINSNGWLESNEAKQLLQDRYALIKTEGKAKVDTEVEAEYDSDGDGIIDSTEAKDLREDLGI